MRYLKKIYLGVIIWLFLGSYVYSVLMMLPFIANTPLAHVASIFNLSGLISQGVSAISYLFLDFWQLIIK